MVGSNATFCAQEVVAGKISKMKKNLIRFITNIIAVSLKQKNQGPKPLMEQGIKDQLVNMYSPVAELNVIW